MYVDLDIHDREKSFCTDERKPLKGCVITYVFYI